MALKFRARLARTISGDPPPVDHWPEAAAQTFKAGDLVFRSGGYVTICGTDPALIGGIAQEDAHNDVYAGTHTIAVTLINADTLIRMQIHHVTPGSSVIAVTDRGTDYGITVSSNVWYVDKAKTSTYARVRVQEFIDPVGTLDGEVAVQFLAANREYA